MSIDLCLLADRVEFIPKIAQWYFDEWGDYAPGNSLEKTVERIKGKLNRACAPLHIVAEENGQPIGVGQLKLREMKEFPELEFWLGSVYVPTACRGRGVASRICAKIAEVARSFGIVKLYLQTEQLDGGLYARQGWQPRERLLVDGVPVLVMSRDL